MSRKNNNLFVNFESLWCIKNVLMCRKYLFKIVNSKQKKKLKKGPLSIDAFFLVNLSIFAPYKIKTIV
jgi:hypothetical protein